MKKNNLLLLLILVISLVGTLSSLLYTEWRFRSIDALLTEKKSLETIHVNDTFSGSPFGQFTDVVDQFDSFQQQITTQRLTPGRNSVSIVHRSTLINGAKVSYTLQISNEEIDGSILVDDPVVKQYLLEQFDKLTVPLIEESDGSLSIEADASLLDEINAILQTSSTNTDILES